MTREASQPQEPRQIDAPGGLCYRGLALYSMPGERVPLRVGTYALTGGEICLAATALAAADLSIPIGAVNSLTGRIVEEGPGPVLLQAPGVRKGLLGA